ncbi:MAG: hypothetical protein AAFQ80_24845 [Cyanobacteria bacterium J06621_8]
MKGEFAGEEAIIDFTNPGLSNFLGGASSFSRETDSPTAVEIFQSPTVEGIRNLDFEFLSEDALIFIPTTTEFAQPDEAVRALIESGLFLTGEDVPDGAILSERGVVKIIGSPDTPAELPQGINLGLLEGGGTIEFLGIKSQGIEGFFTPAGSTEAKPFSLKAANDVGRKANLINIINENGKQIRRAGITDLVLLRIEVNQFGTEELRDFIAG